MIAVRNLILARRRILILGGALSLVTAMFVLLMALSEGISDSLVNSATTLASGHFNVGGFFKAGEYDAAPIVKNVSKVRKIIRQGEPGVTEIIDRLRGWARIVSLKSSIQAGLTGINIQEEPRLTRMLRLAPENEYVEGGSAQPKGQLDTLQSRPGIILFVRQAKRLGVRVGDPLTIISDTYRGQKNSVEVTVSAIVKDIGFISNFSVFTDKKTIRTLYRLDANVTGVIHVYLDNYREVSKVMNRVQQQLTKAGYSLLPYDPKPFFVKFDVVAGGDWRGQRLDITSWKDEIALLSWILTAVNTVSASLMLIMLVIIAVGVMNSFWISVRERTQEIGTLRAIGMSRNRVLAMFLCEAMCLGAASACFGALLGASVAMALDLAHIKLGIEAMRAILMSDILHLVVLPHHLLISIIALTIFCGLSAFLPALRAAQLPPRVALNHAG